MKISKLIEEQLKYPEFAEAYHAEGEKLNTAIALYQTREAVGLD